MRVILDGGGHSEPRAISPPESHTAVTAAYTEPVRITLVASAPPRVTHAIRHSTPGAGLATSDPMPTPELDVPIDGSDFVEYGIDSPIHGVSRSGPSSTPPRPRLQ